MEADRLVIGELDKLTELPEFQKGLRSLIEAAKKRASEIWPGYTFGGMFPQGKQFGITSALPKFFGSTTTHLKHWRQNFASTGWQDIFNVTVQEDIIIGMMGVAIVDPTINITELRAEISDRKYPRINIEEMKAYRKPAVLFKQGLIAEEEKSFKLRGYVTATGYQTVIPIGGFTIFKKLDDVITES